MKKWNDVDGWFLLKEAQMLQRFSKDKVCLILGAYKGKSTLAVAETCKYVFSVDTFKSFDNGKDECCTYTTLDEYTSNIINYKNIFTMIGRSEDIIHRITKNTFDMIFIDGKNTENRTRADIQICWDKLKLGGIMIFHDYEWKGVYNAITDLFTPDEIHDDEALKYVVKKKELLPLVTEWLDYMDYAKYIDYKNKAQVCMDLHAALGIKWGDDPYSVINTLKKCAEPHVACFGSCDEQLKGK